MCTTDEYGIIDSLKLYEQTGQVTIDVEGLAECLMEIGMSIQDGHEHDMFVMSKGIELASVAGQAFVEKVLTYLHSCRKGSYSKIIGFQPMLTNLISKIEKLR